MKITSDQEALAELRRLAAEQRAVAAEARYELWRARHDKLVEERAQLAMAGDVTVWAGIAVSLVAIVLGVVRLVLENRRRSLRRAEDLAVRMSEDALRAADARVAYISRSAGLVPEGEKVLSSDARSFTVVTTAAAFPVGRSFTGSMMAVGAAFPAGVMASPGMMMTVGADGRVFPLPMDGYRAEAARPLDQQQPQVAPKPVIKLLPIETKRKLVLEP